MNQLLVCKKCKVTCYDSNSTKIEGNVYCNKCLDEFKKLYIYVSNLENKEISNDKN